jgi:hypothetical protein
MDTMDYNEDSDNEGSEDYECRRCGGTGSYVWEEDGQEYGCKCPVFCDESCTLCDDTGTYVNEEGMECDCRHPIVWRVRVKYYGEDEDEEEED